MGGKEERSTDESSHSKHKIKKKQFSIIKENHSRYTTSTNQCVRKKKRGVMMKAAIQNTKQKRHKFQSSKKNIKGTHHPLIRVGRKNKMGVMMKAVIQKTK